MMMQSHSLMFLMMLSDMTCHLNIHVILCTFTSKDHVMDLCPSLNYVSLLECYHLNIQVKMFSYLKKLHVYWSVFYSIEDVVALMLTFIAFYFPSMLGLISFVGISSLIPLVPEP